MYKICFKYDIPNIYTEKKNEDTFGIFEKNNIILRCVIKIFRIFD